MEVRASICSSPKDYEPPPDFPQIQAKWLKRLTSAWQNVRPHLKTRDDAAALAYLKRDGKVEEDPRRCAYYRRKRRLRIEITKDMRR